MNHHNKSNAAIDKELENYLNNKGNKQLLLVDPNNYLIYMDTEEEKASLKELQRLVDGYIELYPKEDENFLFIVDEEGILKNKPYNALAKQLFDIDVVGALVVCPKELFD